MVKKKSVGAPIGNKNAEVWTQEEAEKLFDTALEFAVMKDDQGGYLYDFIGELTSELGTFKEIFSHLEKRFPHLKDKNRMLHERMEANCYSNTKKGKIKEATGIVNLKSNHKWRDRSDFTSDDERLEGGFIYLPEKKPEGHGAQL